MPIMTAYIGLGFDRHNAAIPSRQSANALDALAVELSRITGGCTIHYANGFCLDANSALVSERSAVVTVVTHNAALCRVAFIQAAQSLNQQTILIIHHNQKDYPEFYDLIYPEL